jgi:hypothetical protein
MLVLVLNLLLLVLFRPKQILRSSISINMASQFFVLIHVDDIIAATSTPSAMIGLLHSLKHDFALKNLVKESCDA